MRTSGCSSFFTSLAGAGAGVRVIESQPASSSAKVAVTARIERFSMKVFLR